jgi:hypothetical protein
VVVDLDLKHGAHPPDARTPTTWLLKPLKGRSKLATLLISKAEPHAACVPQRPIWLSAGDENFVGLASFTRAPGGDGELFAAACVRGCQP